jgi:beta-lactamase superfamily II metal-dependent hydrolase
MNIKFLKAGTGDSILIQHGDFNIIVDCGNDSTHLLYEVSKIHELGQHIDLLIITHHDDDHIKGAIDLLKAVTEKEYETGFIREIMFNSLNVLAEKFTDSASHELSFRQAQETEALVKKLGIKHQVCNSQTPLRSFGNMNLTFLSPINEDLEAYLDKGGAYLSSDYRCDWDSSVEQLYPYVDDVSQDKSFSNKTSIVVLVECNNKRVLLSGDVTPNRFEAILDSMAAQIGKDQVEFDYVKLPHHCSYRSLNKNILSRLKCNKFIISTNSRKHYLPNKRGILKVIKYLKTDQEIEFLFNYEEALSNLKITAQEAKKYRFKLTKNNKEYGLSI